MSGDSYRGRTRAILACIALWAGISATFLGVATGAERPTLPVPVAICDTFGTKCERAMKVAFCESRLNPRAVSATRDVGLFQANYSAHRRSGESFTAFKRRLFDVGNNIAFAWRLSRQGTDWDAWRWSAHCWRAL